MTSKVTPDYLDSLESERQFTAQGNKSRRVKIEKGQALLVRFLPFHMGPNKHPFARISNHWFGMKPYVCPRHTHPDFGGLADAYCPICEVADHLHSNAPSDEARDAAYKIKSNPQWLMWCLVIAKDDGRSELEYVEPPQLWMPYEFQISKSAWEELSAMMRRQASRGGDILDVETGMNIWATRIKKGIRFDRDDNGPSPIVGPDQNYDEIIAKVWQGCKEPVVKIESEDKLALVAEKIQEQFESGNFETRSREGGDRFGRRRSDDDGGEDDRGGRGRRREDEDDRGARRPSRTEPEDDLRYDDPQPPPLRHRSVQAEPPARRAVAQAPASSAPPARRTAPPVQEPADDGQGDDCQGGDGSQDAPPPPPPPPQRPPTTRTQPPPPPPRAAAPIARPGLTTRPSPVPPPPRRPSAPPPPTRGSGASLQRLPAAATEAAPTGEQSIDENEENVPEEQIDPAPPAAAPLPEESEAPVATPLSPPRATGSLDGALRARIAKLNQRSQ